MKVINIVLRFIACPFVFVIIFIKYNFHAIHNTICFLLYGGEWITYAQGDRHTISEVYHVIKNDSMSGYKRRVLEFLKNQSIALSPTEIGLALGATHYEAPAKACSALKDLVKEGFVIRTEIKKENGQRKRVEYKIK